MQSLERAVTATETKTVTAAAAAAAAVVEKEEGMLQTLISTGAQYLRQAAKEQFTNSSSSAPTEETVRATQQRKDALPTATQVVKDVVKATETNTVEQLIAETDSGKVLESTYLNKSQPLVATSTSDVVNVNVPSETTTTPTQKQPPLNILIFYPDDMRHDSIGIAGTQAVKTPFLDSLARKGMRFTHNCVTTSICWISRATLFTGQYVSRHQASKLFRPINPDKWNETWPSLLQSHGGYYTGHIGKWQYHDSGRVPSRYNVGKVYEGTHMHGTEHVTDLNEKDALEFLKQRPKDQPFALQIAFYAPKAVGSGEMQWTPKNSSSHLYTNMNFTYPPNMEESFARLPPFHSQNRFSEARKRWTQRFGTPQRFDASMKAYYRMISEVDECIQNVVAEVERQGLLNETMIIFTTDNGFFHSEHGLSGKWFPYQESIRVPLIIWDPRMPESVRGTTNDEFTLNIDLAETILGAANLSPPPSMQGRDIADLYLPGRNNNNTWRKEFYYEFPGQGSSRIIPAANAVVRKDFKLFRYPEHNLTQLFNLQEDPLEEFDLANDPKYAHVVEELQRRYTELMASVV